MYAFSIAIKPIAVVNLRHKPWRKRLTHLKSFLITGRDKMLHKVKLNIINSNYSPSVYGRSAGNFSQFIGF